MPGEKSDSFLRQSRVASGVAADTPEDAEPHRQTQRFLLLYALAAAGGSASYAPFLTVILPQRVSNLAGADTVQVLSLVALVGAIAASVSNLFFGWVSDRTQSRRGWIVVGLALSCALLITMRLAHSVPQLLVMIFVWQTALNMMLNPLAAWAGDVVPDRQKGTLGGLLSLAPGVGALAGALVTIPGLASGDERLVLVALLVCLLVLPAVLFGRPRPMPHLMVDRVPAALQMAPEDEVGRVPRRSTVPVWRMWLARLLVQIAEATLFAFLFLWLRGVDAGFTDNNAATIFTVVLFGSVPVAILAGRWSDRAGRPMFPLIIAAACGVVGLLIMAATQSAEAGVVGYCVFGIAAAVFLALHSSQTLRVLPRPSRRGRDLGIFNLTNTIPSLIMPALALALIPLFGFAALFVLLAGFVAAAGALLVSRRTR